MAKETENLDIDPVTIQQGLEKVLANPKLGTFYVAYEEPNSDAPIGCLMTTYEMSPKVGGLIHWIQSVYVAPEHRKKGAFKTLYNHVISIARADPLVKAVRLYVEKDNKNAQATYERMGMRKVEGIAFEEIDYGDFKKPELDI